MNSSISSSRTTKGKDEWRITTAAIQLEMERIAGLLQKSIHFQSRTSAPHSAQQRHEAVAAGELARQRNESVSAGERSSSIDLARQR
jgi:hypothetical protein